jgi:hypothetical protein
MPQHATDLPGVEVEVGLSVDIPHHGTFSALENGTVIVRSIETRAEAVVPGDVKPLLLTR